MSTQREDNKKFNELIKNNSFEKKGAIPRSKPRNVDEASPCTLSNEKEESITGGFVQWTTHNNKTFVPATTSTEKIVPGVYEIQHSNSIGIYFEKIPVLTVGLIRFPQTNSDFILEEIQKFWDRAEIFEEYNITHKRGVLFWGPPGGGKTSCIQLILNDIVERGGIAVRFTSPSLFNEGMRKFREIEPNTPVVVLMEDLDAILEQYNESEVLNILDGINKIDKIVFICSSNFPERLNDRIVRTSRIDRRIFVGNPSPESRKLYLTYIIGENKIDELNIDLNKWIKDTEGFSIAHLKELFISTIILGNNYEESLEILQDSIGNNMNSEADDSEDGRRKLMGLIPR